MSVWESPDSFSILIRRPHQIPSWEMISTVIVMSKRELDRIGIGPSKGAGPRPIAGLAAVAQTLQGGRRNVAMGSRIRTRERLAQPGRGRRLGQL